ncbi:MAG: transcriptional regulator [Epulopiscium sp. Nele67-Bin004]|nr:MAG: transcriptional regulator [Epulopiscium sp. Nele67-Bin004]
MVFSSLVFLFVFLPIFLAIYYVAPRGLRNFILFAASLIFYAWGEPIYVGLMIFSTVLDYSLGLFINKFRDNKKIAKLGMITSICANMGLLAFFKYSNFFVDNINNVLGLNIKWFEVALPIGISFYTFQTMSYTIDLYREKIAVQRNIISFGAYVAMFPQLIAGPIVQYQTIEKELNDRKETISQFELGVERFIQGLGKKVLIANSVGLLWETMQGADQLTVASAWLGIVAFALQIYFDFSGYSDMAIGLGHMMGFNLPENFRHPYVSKSVTEFWRRWHITLGSWFREYVYIPLGGNRVGKPRFYFNLLVVWFLTGLWHGANWNFIVWGLMFGGLMVVERTWLLDILERLPKLVSHMYLIFVVLISWVFFAIEDIGQIGDYLGAMFGANGFVDNFALYYVRNYAVTLVVAIVFATPIMSNLGQRLNKNVVYVFYMGVLVLSTAYLVDSTFNPFLYFRF